jgi:SAM-dependent methyltransferase
MINWVIENQVKNFFSNIKNSNILDFGCGDCRYKKYSDQTNNYIGLDIEVSGHDKKKKKYDILWDGKIIPFENEKFDLILMTEVLEHIENVELTLLEIHRVLKISGKLLITSPFIWHEHQKPYDFQRFTSFGLESLMKKTGFSIIYQKKLISNKHAIIEILNSELNKKINYNNNIFYRYYLILLKFFFKITFKILVHGKLFEDYYISNCVVVKKFDF